MSDKKDDGRRKGQELKRLAVGYARVSTASQGESGISLDAQRVAIEKFAEAMGYHLIDTFRDVASGVGASSFHQRPGLKSALEVASRNNADLLVWDWHRLSRHAGFEKQIKAVLDDPDRITCVKQGTRLKNAARDATFAHDESVAREISRTTKEGMQRKRAGYCADPERDRSSDTSWQTVDKPASTHPCEESPRALAQGRRAGHAVTAKLWNVLSPVRNGSRYLII
ncbi:MAG: recombinase family protein [Loktanella sp.]|nr:recombinase family protein [Loktanella sp.]